MMKHPGLYKHDAQGEVVSPYDWTDVASFDYSKPEPWGIRVTYLSPDAFGQAVCRCVA